METRYPRRMIQRLEKPSVVVAMAALAIVILACKKGEGSHCAFNKDCKDELVCLEATCKTLADAKKTCESDTLCTTLGQCSVSTAAGDAVPVCMAKSDDDCKKGPCKDGTGKCHAANGMCTE